MENQSEWLVKILFMGHFENISSNIIKVIRSVLNIFHDKIS